MKIYLSACIVLLALGEAAVAAPPAGAATLALVGGRVIDGYGGAPLENAIVLITDNRIASVGRMESLSIPDGAKVIDVNGMSVLPGLWESDGHLMHIGEGDPEQFPRRFASQVRQVMAAVARASLLSGVTSFRDTGGPFDEQLALRADIEAGRVAGPRLFLAGPILRQEQRDPRARRKSDDPDGVATPRQARQAAERVIALGVDQIKVAGFWDPDILREITGAAHRAGIGVDADVRHVTAYRTAIQAGVDRLHHVFLADALSDYGEDDLRLLVAGVRPTGVGPMADILRGPYIVPAVEMRQAYVRALNFPELLDHPRFREQYPADVHSHLRSSWTSPAAIPWGVGAPQRVQSAKRKLRRFIEAGGREQLVAGTDAGSPLNVHSPLTREIRRLHEAGLTAMEAIQSATLRPAQMQGKAQDLGTVSAGKLADLVVVDGDPLQDISVLEHCILLVIKDGALYEPRRRSLLQR